MNVHEKNSTFVAEIIIIMTLLEQIRKPIEKELHECRDYMRSNMVADDPFVQSMLDYIIENTGKAARPSLVLLASRLHATQSLGERSYLAAMLVEMVHTASLVHDDVIDESDMRRGNPSVNSRWGANSAVLCGDFILAAAFERGLTSGHYDIPRYIIGAMKELCTGEIVQNECNRRRNMTRELYFDIIYKKTAVLLATSAAVGALAVGADDEAIDKMFRWGRALGMAFQIKDDLLDYDADAATGKPSFNDLHEGKITLPLLCVMEQNEALRERCMQLVSEGSYESLAEVCRLVAENGGLRAAADVMDEFIVEARSIVASYPDSEVRSAMEAMCDFVAARNN